MNRKEKILAFIVITMLALCLISVGMALGYLVAQPKLPEPVAPSTTYCVQTLAAKQSTPAKGTPAERPKTAEPEMVSLGTFKVTHYCPCAKCCGKSDGITATGTKATPGRTLAVDPRVIPYGTKVVLKYSDGTTEDYIAEDRGGAIKGNRVDVFMGQHRAALYAGVRTAEVFIYG